MDNEITIRVITSFYLWTVRIVLLEKLHFFNNFMKRCKKREKKIFYRPLGKHYERVKGKLVEISIMNGV